MAPPSLTWTSWKWIALSSSAPNTFTGTVTAPNAIAPFQIERGMAAHYPGRQPSARLRVAGELGFEPRFTVLETARFTTGSLPLTGRQSNPRVLSGRTEISARRP